MANEVVLVNGLPGSGKTTLAQALSVHLNAQWLSKDLIKEALAELLNEPLEIPTLGAIAMETLWQLAAVATGTVVLDSFWFRPRDLLHAEAGLRAVGAPRAVEVWCDVPSELARERCKRRRRNPVHQDAHRLAADWDLWAHEAEPLALAPVINVDTSERCDLAAVVRQVRAALLLSREDPAPIGSAESRPSQ